MRISSCGNAERRALPQDQYAPCKAKLELIHESDPVLSPQRVVVAGLRARTCGILQSEMYATVERFHLLSVR